jgi:hypothetical protein
MYFERYTHMRIRPSFWSQKLPNTCFARADVSSNSVVVACDRFIKLDAVCASSRKFQRSEPDT